LTFCRDVQSLKANHPISVTDSGISMVSRDEQSLKAYHPILVTELGMQMEVMDSSFISKRMVPVSSRIRFGAVMVVSYLVYNKVRAKGVQSR